MKKLLLLCLSLALCFSAATLLLGCEPSECSHEWEITTETVAAGCEAAGTEAIYTCKKCKETKGGEAIAALGHDWQESVAKVEPGCESKGAEAIYACGNCGATKGGEEIAALGHDWQESTAKVDPGCETEGKEISYICLNGCGQTQGGETISATGHQWTAVAEQPATCTEDGHKAHWTCEHCDAVATGEADSQVKVDASSIVLSKGHTLANGEAKTATCQELGWDAYEYCTKCDYTTKKTYYADHAYNSGVCACGKHIEETYLLYDGSTDNVVYDATDKTWTLTAASGKVLHLSTEAIQSYMDSNISKLMFVFGSKPNQKTSLNAVHNGDHSGNVTTSVTVELTEEMKSTGLDMRIYYETFSGGSEASDGFVVSIGGIVKFSYENKSTWMTADNMDVSYDETKGAFVLNAREGSRTGYHQPAISTELIAVWKNEGYDSLRVTVSSLNNVFCGFQSVIPNYTAVNLGSFNCLIDLNSLPASSEVTFKAEGYWAMRWYTNADIDGLVVKLDPVKSTNPAEMVTYDGSSENVVYDATSKTWMVNNTAPGKYLKIDANLIKSYIQEGYTSISVNFGSKEGQQTKWNVQFLESGGTLSDNLSNAGSVTVTKSLESYMGTDGISFCVWFYDRGWAGDPIGTDGFTVSITVSK